MHHTPMTALREDRVLFILRGDDPDAVVEAAEATWAAGGRIVEIPLNSAEAISTLDHLVWRIPDGCFLGAGTIRRPEEVALVRRIGVSFVVSPIATRELADACREHALVSVLGAATPTEIYQAWSWGADFVKVFPAPSPADMRRLRTPLDDVPMVAVGGVTFSNVRDYLDAGCVAVGVGGSFYGAGPLPAPGGGAGGWGGNRTDEVKERVWALLETIRKR